MPAARGFAFRHRATRDERSANCNVKRRLCGGGGRKERPMSPIELPIWGNLFVLFIVLAWCLWWPRVIHEGSNPYSRGEDYWIPFRPYVGSRYSRGPDLFFFLHRADHRLRKRVTKELYRAKLVDVVARSRDGTVTLYGYVEESGAKLKAAKIAASVAGVVRVRNEVAVQAKPKWLQDGEM